MIQIKKNFKNIPPQAIERWVDKNFDYKKRKGKNGEELLIENPFYHNDNKKFNISLSRAACHDWRGDEWAGPINPETGKRNCSFIKFVRLYNKCSYKEALEDILGDKEDIRDFLKPEGRMTDKEAQKKVSVALPNGARLLSNANDTQANALKKWLNTRGYSEEDISKNELYYLGMEVYWPYYEFDTLIYWQSRSRVNKRFNFPSLEVYDKDGKVVGITDGTKGDFLYGFDDIEAASYVIITEAIFDKHILGEQTLASGGAVVTDNQIKKLKILGPKKGVILSPDNDKAGINSIISNVNLLSRHGLKIYFSIPPRIKYIKKGEKLMTKDWNEFFTELNMSTDEIRKIHDKNIKSANTMELVKLRKILK